ncbi:hypothetical protein [Bordetella trematum]|nr:hypothetical protein [Bordetella trematum]
MSYRSVAPWLSAGFPMQVLDIRYTVGGGAGVPRAELLIQSWLAE